MPGLGLGVRDLHIVRDSDTRFSRDRRTRDTRAQACRDCPAARIGLCARLSPRCRQDLLAIAEREYLPAGAVIGEEGAPARTVTTITEGVVALTKRAAGGGMGLVGLRFAGDTVMPYRHAFTWPVTARTLGPCRICRLSFEQASHLPAQNAELKDALHDVAMEQVEDGFGHVLLRGHKGVDRMMACFLLEFAARSQNSEDPQEPIDIPLTRSEMADYLGLRTETVSRAFGRLKAGGLLALPKPKQIVILDRPALEALAKGRRAR